MVIVVKNTHEHEGSKGIKSRLAPQPVSSRTSKSFPRSSAKPSLKSPKTLSKPSIAFPYVPHSSSSSNACPRSLANSNYDWVDLKNEDDNSKILCELLHEAQKEEIFHKKRKSTGKNSHTRNRNVMTANEKAIASAIRNATNESIMDETISSQLADAVSDETIANPKVSSFTPSFRSSSSCSSPSSSPHQKTRLNTSNPHCSHPTQANIKGALPTRTFVDNYFSPDIPSSLCLETSAPDSGEFVFV